MRGAPRPAARAARAGAAPRRTVLALALLLLAILIDGLAPAPARAQAGADDAALAERWDRAATQAEAQVAQPEVSRTTLERLREQMVLQRTEAAAVRERADQRLAPLRIQAQALGPTPGDGATEAPEIAEQRRRLAEQIAAAELPLRASDAAYRRADALIDRIDQILRARFRDQLLLRQQSPLDPTTWLPVIAEGSDRFGRALRDAAIGMSRAGPNVWIAAAAGAAGLVLLLVVRRRVMEWLERLLATRIGGERPSRRWLWAGGGLTIAALVLPAIAAGLLLFALRQSGMANGYAAPYVRDAGYLALALIVAYWLAEAFFGPDVPVRDMMPMQPRKARRAARMTLVLGLVAGLDRVLVSGGAAAWMSLDAIALYNFVLLAVGGGALWRLASAAAPEAPAAKGPEGEGEEAAEAAPAAQIGLAIHGFLVRATRIAAVAAPVLAALGFYAGSRFVFHPFLITLAVIGAWLVIVALVHHAVDEVIASTAAEAEAHGGPPRHSSLRLLPAAAGFLLACVAVPLLALVWGAREADLDEALRIFAEGLRLGENRISPLDFLTFAVIFVAGYAITRFAQSILRGTVLPQTALDSGGRMAVVSMVGYVGVFVAALVAISATGLDLSNLAIVAGALSVGVGFGLQNVVSNFVSGLILLVERPVKEGDWIRVGEFEGFVRRISVRATMVQTFDRAIVVVPNADLISRPVLNRTHSGTTGRVQIPVGVAYGSDTRKVEAVLREIAAGCDLLLRRPPPNVAFRGFGADALNFEVIGFLRDVNTSIAAVTWLNHAIAERFAREGISIPFAQRDVTLKNAGEILAAWQRGALVPAPEAGAPPPPGAPGPGGMPEREEDGAAGRDARREEGR